MTHMEAMRAVLQAAGQLTVRGGENVTAFKQAEQIADAASFFDYIKSFMVMGEDDLTQAVEHIENLHNIAQALAGDRVHEIYAMEEETCAGDSASQSCSATSKPAASITA